MAVDSWDKLKALGQALAARENLTGIEETTSWGQPTLKAHGKLWCWWSPSEHAPVFKMDKEERAFLIEVDPDRFFVTPHYQPHNLVLVQPALCEEDWAEARLLAQWQAAAPKRLLKAWLAARGPIA